MKIAFVDYVLEPTKPGLSGLSDMVWDMASALVDQGHEVHVVASYHTQKYPDNRVKVHNFPTPPIGYRNIIGQLWILARAAKILRHLKKVYSMFWMHLVCLNRVCLSTLEICVFILLVKAT